MKTCSAVDCPLSRRWWGNSRPLEYYLSQACMPLWENTANWQQHRAPSGCLCAPGAHGHDKAKQLPSPSCFHAVTELMSAHNASDHHGRQTAHAQEGEKTNDRAVSYVKRDIYWSARSEIHGRHFTYNLNRHSRAQLETLKETSSFLCVIYWVLVVRPD